MATGTEPEYTRRYEGLSERTFSEVSYWINRVGMPRDENGYRYVTFGDASQVARLNSAERTVELTQGVPENIVGAIERRMNRRQEE